MSQETISALLGRPLTDVEIANFNLYLNISNQALGDLLCMDLCSKEDPRTFDAREGYSTVFTDIFTDIQEVKLNGTVTTDYSVRQWDKRSGSWYNSLVFSNRLDEGDEVEVSASWGFTKIPVDLQLLIARLFDLITRENNLDREINSKKVEDFTITYNHSSITMSDTLRESLLKDNASVISRYSLCNMPYVKHGKVDC